NFAHPLAAATFVSAAVSVVFPWSMWPMVPTLTWGFERSNFSFAITLSRIDLAGREAPPYTANLRCRAPLYAAPDLFGPLNPRYNLFRHVLRCLFVPIEVHRVRRTPLCPRPQIRGVPEHLRQRDAGIDDLRAAAILLRLNPSAPAGQVAHHVAHVVL